MADKEIDAMGKISQILSGFNKDEVARILAWAGDRFKVEGIKKQDIKKEEPPEDVSTFFSQAKPKKTRDKALVIGYWLQVVKDQKDFISQEVNNELKNLGHGAKNITQILDRLIEHRPQLVIQTQKKGTARQSRKKYKLTQEGIKEVKKMLSGHIEDEE